MKNQKRYSTRKSKTKTYNGQPLWAVTKGQVEIKWFISKPHAEIAKNTLIAEGLIDRTYVPVEAAAMFQSKKF